MRFVSGLVTHWRSQTDFILIIKNLAFSFESFGWVSFAKILHSIHVKKKRFTVCGEKPPKIHAPPRYCSDDSTRAWAVAVTDNESCHQVHHDLDSMKG